LKPKLPKIPPYAARLDARLKAGKRLFFGLAQPRVRNSASSFLDFNLKNAPTFAGNKQKTRK
jgi:hypothetical protein